MNDHDLDRSADAKPVERTNLDPGAFIGHEPELAADRLPEGLGPDDERVAAHSTQGTGVGRPDLRGQPEDVPDGHREGPDASHDARREAGQDR